MNIRTLTEERIDQIANRINELQRCCNPSENKFIHCKKHGNTAYFYLRHNGSETYIPIDDTKTLRSAARNSYAKTVIPVLQKDLKALENLLHKYSWKNELFIADRLDPDIIRLCGKGFSSRRTYIENWSNQTWEENPDLGDIPDRPTIKGHIVRSKSEEFIDNALYHHGLSFFYEKPLYLDEASFPLFPDFTILHPETLTEIYWEHFGLMDDPLYADRNCKKIKQYMRNDIYPGERLICTFETRNHPLSSVDVEMIIKKYFE